jgi:hypothetical protein
MTVDFRRQVFEAIMMALILLLILARTIAAQQPGVPDRRPIGEIEFFGYKGLDVERLRAALSLREGDLFPPENSDDNPAEAINRTVRGTLGRDATDVNFTCCDGRQLWMVYIGVPGDTYHAVTFNRAPVGSARLPADVVRLNDELGDAWTKAVMKGNGAEDRSQGFSLLADPVVRALQLQLRRYALSHEGDVMRVLETSADAGHRSAAAMALGYARASARQVSGLLDACFDADATVRNNAARALDVLFDVRSDLAKRARIGRVIPLLTSGQWTDHNKGVHLVELLTRGRDPRTLAAIRAGALENLVEMARWRSEGHAGDARLVLGRVAGIDETRLQELVRQGRIDEIISAASVH